MKKTKHFNISVPELGDVPDITQVSNAISDLEDATAGTLEIMKAEMQGTKITLTSVSRKTKRTGYYEGMSIRFKSPQDIEPNYLKTISVDGLGDQTLSVAYKVNRNEYIDIVYEGNKFTAYPVVVQKTDSVSENSSILVGTAKGVKTAYDKGVEALNKANQAQSSANNAQSTADEKVSKNGDTMTGALTIEDESLKLMHKESQSRAIGISGLYRDQKIYGIGGVIHKNEFKHMYVGVGADIWDNAKRKGMYFKPDGDVELYAKNLTTSNKEVITAINELNSGKVSKNGDTITGILKINADKSCVIFDKIYQVGHNKDNNSIYLYNGESNKQLCLYDNGNAAIPAQNLITNNKEVVEAINEVKRATDGKLSLSGGKMTGRLEFNEIFISGNNGSSIGHLAANQALSIFNAKSNCGIKLMDNGNAKYDAKNLITKNKDVVEAVNETYRLATSYREDGQWTIVERGNVIEYYGQTTVVSQNSTHWNCSVTIPNTSYKKAFICVSETEPTFSCAGFASNTKGKFIVSSSGKSNAIYVKITVFM